MSSKRKSGIADGPNKKQRKSKKNGKRKNDEDASDFEDEFGSDSSNDGYNPAYPTANDDVNDSEDLPEGDDTLRVKGPDHVGVFLICGATNWDLSGRKVVPKGTKANMGKNIYTPHRFGPLSTQRVRVVVSSCNSAHSVIITEDYKAMTLGRNEKGQLGTGDTTRRDQPCHVEHLKNHNIVNAACGRNHTLFLTDRGTVYSCGDNKMGQCGVGQMTPMIPTPTRIRYKGPPIVKLCSGADFSVILDLKGALYSFGSPEYGQLGHNTNGEYIASNNRINFRCEKAPKQITTFIEKSKDSHPIPCEITDVQDIACGTNHTVALDSRKRVFSWGFGGYGRLGHADNKDEMVPRLIKYFDTQGKGIKSIFCGSAFSLAVNEHKMLYLFGQQKKTGEANMYPKPIQDLAGWNIRSLSCGNSSCVIAADNSCISFGPSPAYGELGHGEMRKSTTIPMEIKALDGIYIEQVSCGQFHTMMIARDATDDEKERINDLPEYTPSAGT